MALAKTAMMATLGAGMWLGQRVDKRLTTKARNVRLMLLPKPVFDPVVTAANTMRARYYAMTLPWKDNGDRVLTGRLYPRFVKEMAALAIEFDRTADALCYRVYPPMRERIGFRARGFIDQRDYPLPEDLRKRYYTNLTFLPISTAEDFKVDIPEAAEIKARIRADTALRVAQAQGDVIRRLCRVLAHFQQKMASPNATFRNSTVENLDDMIELLPGLNLLEDPGLEHVGHRLRFMRRHSAGELRRHLDARKAEADQAAIILQEVSSCYNRETAIT